MKKVQINTLAKPITKLAFVLFAAAIISSCNSSTGEKTEAEMDTVSNKVEEQVAEVKQDIQEYRDEDFVTDIIKANGGELHLIALAKQKGMDKDLKGHAKMMEADHKKMGTAMQAYATKKGYTVNDDGSNSKDGLDDETPGADWDKKWTNKMVDEHEQVIRKFENAESRATDPELKEMVIKTLPTLRDHLAMVKTLQDKLGK